MKYDRDPLVFVIDDDEAYRASVMAKLRLELDTEIRDFGNASGAIAACADVVPDLVILDLAMPGTSGATFLSTIRSDTRLEGMAVLVLTGHGGTATQVALLEQGADDFVEKGESLAIVTARVRSLLRHQWVRDGVAALAEASEEFAADALRRIDLQVKKVTDATAASLGVDASNLPEALDKLKEAGDGLKELTEQIVGRS